MDVKILGVPMDLGANRRGTDMGPSAIRVAQLAPKLRQLGHEVEDLGNVYSPTAETRTVKHEGLRYLDEIVAVCDILARRVERVAEQGAFPLVLGGDHSIAMGSVGGVARTGDKVGLIWVDAHADMNTTDTSESGNIHGMPLAAIVGLGDERLVGAGNVAPKVAQKNAVIVGLRDVDARERELLKKSGVTAFTMRHIDERGMKRVMEDALAIATDGVDRLHVSFDLDSVDPSDAPGVGTPVPGGLTFREAHLALEMAAEDPKFASMDFVEVNPLLDTRNETARLATDLACSALGKRIL